MRPLPEMTTHFVERLNERARWLCHVPLLHDAWNNAVRFDPERDVDIEIRDLFRGAKYYLTPEYSVKRRSMVLVVCKRRLVTIFPYRA